MTINPPPRCRGPVGLLWQMRRSAIRHDEGTSAASESARSGGLRLVTLGEGI
jgi:hypothetical protein